MSHPRKPGFLEAWERKHQRPPERPQGAPSVLKPLWEWCGRTVSCRSPFCHMPVYFDDADRRECIFLHSEGLPPQAILTVMNTGRKRCEPLSCAPFLCHFLLPRQGRQVLNIRWVQRTVNEQDLPKKPANKGGRPRKLTPQQERIFIRYVHPPDCPGKYFFFCHSGMQESTGTRSTFPNW